MILNVVVSPGLHRGRRQLGVVLIGLLRIADRGCVTAPSVLGVLRGSSVAARRAAVGARRRAPARSLRRTARSRALLDRAVRRHGRRRRSTSASSPPAFAAEQTLTSDTVPVNVDAVLFWMVHDRREGGARSAGLRRRRQLGGADGAPRHHRPHVAGRSAARARQDRGGAAEAHRRAIDPLGRHGAVRRDARHRHPQPLQDAMSREAQAAREKQARIILGEAEVEIAQSFEDGGASRTRTTRRRSTCAR